MIRLGLFVNFPIFFLKEAFINQRSDCLNFLPNVAAFSSEIAKYAPLFTLQLPLRFNRSPNL